MKKYIALLSQNGTSAPVATILENNLGSIVWSRTGTGNYVGTLPGAFPAGKTFVLCNPSDTLDGWDGTGLLATAKRNSDDIIVLNVTDQTLNGQDNELSGFSIEIRVYP